MAKRVNRSGRASGGKVHQRQGLKILVCGYGYVGQQYYNLLSKHYFVHVFDTQKPSVPNRIKNVTRETLWDFVFICVPTPQANDGACDIGAVIHCLLAFRAKTFVIKSTVSIGVTDYLSKKHNTDCVFSPEYCGESSYDNTYEFHTNAVKTPFVVLGGDAEAVQRVYELLLPIVGPQKKWFFLTAKEAEMVKYLENTFYAVKITYCNEMYNVCRALGVDWHKAREAWLADPRINPMHTAVFAGKRGFSGKCLPKDLSALIVTALAKGYSPKLLMQAYITNEEIKANEN